MVIRGKCAERHRRSTPVHDLPCLEIPLNTGAGRLQLNDHLLSL